MTDHKIEGRLGGNVCLHSNFVFEGFGPGGTVATDLPTYLLYKRRLLSFLWMDGTGTVVTDRFRFFVHSFLLLPPSRTT